MCASWSQRTATAYLVCAVMLPMTLLSTSLPAASVNRPIEGSSTSTWGDFNRGIWMPQPGRRAGFSHAALSQSGRYVAFASTDSEIVRRDSTRFADVFLRDRHEGTTRLISRSDTGVQGNADSWEPQISPDGRFVAFPSAADNLAVSDTQSTFDDIFLRDTEEGVTVLVTNFPSDQTLTETPELTDVSSHGRKVVFDYQDHVYVWSRSTGLASPIAHQTLTPSIAESGGRITPDGQWIAYCSVVNERGRTLSYLQDLTTGATEIASISTTGRIGNGNNCFPGPLVSDTGRFVVFQSSATNLTPHPGDGESIFIRDRREETTTRVPYRGTTIYDLALSPSGTYLVYETRNGFYTVGGEDVEIIDIGITNRITGRTRLVSVTSAGRPSRSSYSPEVSRHARVISFTSLDARDDMIRGAPSHTGIFVRINKPR